MPQPVANQAMPPRRHCSLHSVPGQTVADLQPLLAKNRKVEAVMVSTVKLASWRPQGIAKDWDLAPIIVEKIADLVFRWDLYPRHGVDHKDVVRNYARALRAGCVFPPVKVGFLNEKKIIVDGVHRIRSRQLLNIEYVDCATLRFESEAELFAEAVRLNSNHGKSFTVEEIDRNITRLRKYNFDVKDIVAITHVPASEITRESAAPVKVLRAPCGKKIYCTGQPDVRELVEFKNALMLIRDVAGCDCIPRDDPLFKGLVLECREALGRMKFNA